MCVVCVNVGLYIVRAALHLYQCNSFIISNYTVFSYSEKNIFKGSFIQQSNINFILYNTFQHFIYMADNVLLVCLCMYI